MNYGHHILFVLAFTALLQSSHGSLPSGFRFIEGSCHPGTDSGYNGSNYRRRRRYVPNFDTNKEATTLFSRIASAMRSKVLQNAMKASTLSSICRSVKANEHLSFGLKDVPNLLKGIAGSLPRWVRFPKLKLNRDLLVRISSVIKVTVLAAFSIELFFILRDVFEEVFGELQEAVEDVFTGTYEVFSTSDRKALSQSEVKKIIKWLKSKAAPSPSSLSTIAPPWVLTVAEELHNSAALSISEVQRILSTLSDTDMALLASLLLDTKTTINFEDIGGLFAARSTAGQLLVTHLSALRDAKQIPTSNASPFRKFITDGRGVCNMILWGPTGSGKSLLAHSIAKSSGLPSLLITPSRMQQRDSVDRLFSLISTIGSCVIVIDDFDALFPVQNSPNYDPAKNDMRMYWLHRWDKLVSSSTKSLKKPPPLIIAATSKPWEVDTAAWRRISNRLYVGLPNTEDRYDMVKKWSKDLPPLDDTIMKYLVDGTEGYLPSDIYQVLINAIQQGPFIRQDAELDMEDIKIGLSSVMPTRYSALYIKQLKEFLDAASTSESPHGPQRLSSERQHQDYFTPRGIQKLPNCENGFFWQTPLGSFYQYKIPVDSQVLDAIQVILLHGFEWGMGEESNSMDGWDLSDYEDEDNEGEDFDDNDAE